MRGKGVYMGRCGSATTTKGGEEHAFPTVCSVVKANGNKRGCDKGWVSHNCLFQRLRASTMKGARGGVTCEANYKQVLVLFAVLNLVCSTV